MPPAAKTPLAPVANPKLSDIESDAELYLGRRLTLEAVLRPGLRLIDTRWELKLALDAKTPANRVQYLVPASLGEQLETLTEPRAVKITGTVMAPANSRARYIYEIEEIAFVEPDGSTSTVLKPILRPLPVWIPPANSDADASETSATESPSGSKQTAPVPTGLIVVAVLMALGLVGLMVVGLRMMKHLKHAKPRRSLPVKKRPEKRLNPKPATSDSVPTTSPL